MPKPDCFLRYRMFCNAEFYYVGKFPRIGIGHPSLQQHVVFKWFYSLRAVGTTLSKVHALHRMRRSPLAQCAAAGQVHARHHDAPLSTQLCSPVPLWLLHPGHECCRSQSTTIHQPPSSCCSPLQHEHVRPSGLLCRWPNGLELTARQAPRPIAIDWQFPSPA